VEVSMQNANMLVFFADDARILKKCQESGKKKYLNCELAIDYQSTTN
jgi:hypothetical protein